jgi:undecaprenyl pyrophosphate phosphatase UppP
MDIKNIIKNAAHYADILAIPMFLIAFLYFLLKDNKTIFEYFLMVCMLIGLVLDSIFTIQFFYFND